jgi:hypothetical protein
MTIYMTVKAADIRALKQLDAVSMCNKEQIEDTIQLQGDSK